MTLNIAPFDLREAAAGVVEMLTAQASAKGLALTLEYASGIPAALLGDAARIRQVLVNLVANAIKFTERGAIAVSIQCTEPAASGASLALEVRDTGIGIPADKLELIFDKFTQADGSMTRRYGGTGLGLTLVKQLVELMGGSIGVRSQLGVGTTFTIRLHLALAAADQFSAGVLVGKEANSC
jgi:signal transduction histidine kinase